MRIKRRGFLASIAGAALALAGVWAKPNGTNKVVTIPDVFTKPKPIVVVCSKCGSRRELRDILTVVVAAGGKLICEKCAGEPYARIVEVNQVTKTVTFESL